jgi:hypothetical protein
MELTWGLASDPQRTSETQPSFEGLLALDVNIIDARDVKELVEMFLSPNTMIEQLCNRADIDRDQCITNGLKSALLQANEQNTIFFARLRELGSWLQHDMLETLQMLSPIEKLQRLMIPASYSPKRILQHFVEKFSPINSSRPYKRT